MANFPTRYYPDYPQTPGLGYSPYRSQYPPSQMGSGYPSTGAMFTTEYPSIETTTKPSNADPATTSGFQVINKRYKYYGYLLVFLAFAIFGVEIGNIAYTCTRFDVSNTKLVPKPFGTPYVLTWIAPGIWGSIPLFITGYLAVRVSGKYGKQIRIFALFCALSATVFTPAIIAISITEIVLYPKNNYLAALCYNFVSVSTLSCPKFVLAAVVAVLGGIAFILTVLVTVVFSFWWDPQGDFSSEEPETTQVIDEYYPYTRQPPMSLPPPAQPYPEQAPVYRGPAAPRGMVEPDMDFLRSYPVYRQASSRGFGFAPAYNRQSYGTGRFQGMLPSLTTGFGNQEPNPAYMVPYA